MKASDLKIPALKVMAELLGEQSSSADLIEDIAIAEQLHVSVPLAQRAMRFLSKEGLIDLTEYAGGAAASITDEGWEKLEDLESKEDETSDVSINTTLPTRNAVVSFGSNNNQTESNTDISGNIAGHNLYKDNTFNFNVGSSYHTDSQEEAFADLTDQQRELIILLVEKMQTNLYREGFLGIHLQQKGWMLSFHRKESNIRDHLDYFGFDRSTLNALFEEGYITLTFTSQNHCQGAVKQRAYQQYRLWKKA